MRTTGAGSWSMIYVTFYGKERSALANLPVKTDQDTLREGYSEPFRASFPWHISMVIVTHSTSVPHCPNFSQVNLLSVEITGYVIFLQVFMAICVNQDTRS
ncbi:uncharacterized protein LOC130139598 [Syzygium oleosum]|uniref:uncharacterized protein LOC130139598 n=1 Tax=Syzygium oleosum TaxID=219896 RepID=UPI0024B9FA52|nr:uncharacterized protein LOC130139598 [Syzygium oleosum]